MPKDGTIEDAPDMILTGAGQVGIGAQNPAGQLDVATPSHGYSFVAEADKVQLVIYSDDHFGCYPGTRSNHSLSFFTNGRPFF